MKSKSAEIAKEVKCIDGWWRFACGDVSYMTISQSLCKSFGGKEHLWTKCEILSGGVNSSVGMSNIDPPLTSTETPMELMGGLIYLKHGML